MLLITQWNKIFNWLSKYLPTNSLGKDGSSKDVDFNFGHPAYLLLLTGASGGQEKALHSHFNA